MSAITAWFDQQHVSFAALVTSAAVLVIAALAIPLVKRLLRNWLIRIEARIQLSEATVSAMIRIVSVGLWLTAVAILPYPTWTVVFVFVALPIPWHVSRSRLLSP